MKFIKNIFHIEHCLITLLAFVQLMFWGTLVFNLDFLNPISNALKNFSITDMFFEIERSEDSREINDFITLIDITEIKDRGDLALLLDDLESKSPTSIGVDIIFDGFKYDSLGNAILMDVVNKISSKTVFAKKLINYSSEGNTFTNEVNSFFADSIDVIEGFANLTDNMQGSNIRDFVLRTSLNGNDQLSFPLQIKSLIDNEIEYIKDYKYLINYRNVLFPIVKPYEIDENTDIIENHVVLVGAVNQEEDMHNTPIGKLSGLEIQAYSLLTLLEHRFVNHTPKWINWIIAFVFCYLFEIIIHGIYSILERYKNNIIMIFLNKSNVIAIICLFIYMVIVCWLLFYSFVEFNIIVEGNIVLATLALMYESRSLYKAMIKSLEVKYHWSIFRKSIINN